MKPAQSGARLRRLLLVQLYVSLLLWGGAQVFSNNAGVHYVFTLFVASCVTWWVVSDAVLLGYPTNFAAVITLFLFWPLATPLYLIWTRGIRGLGWTLLHAVGLVLAYNVGLYFAAMLSKIA